MFDQLFNRPRGLKRHTTAPLAEERVRYLSHCAEQGTRKSSLRRIAQAQLMIIEQLGLTADVKVTSKHIEAAADRWAALDRPQRQSKDFRKARIALHQRCNAVAPISGSPRCTCAPARTLRASSQRVCRLYGARKRLGFKYHPH